MAESVVTAVFERFWRSADALYHAVTPQSHGSADYNSDDWHSLLGPDSYDEGHQNHPEQQQQRHRDQVQQQLDLQLYQQRHPTYKPPPRNPCPAVWVRELDRPAVERVYPLVVSTCYVHLFNISKDEKRRLDEAKQPLEARWVSAEQIRVRRAGAETTRPGVDNRDSDARGSDAVNNGFALAPHMRACFELADES